MLKISNYIYICVKFFSKNEFFCFMLAWFMIILICGTLAQKEIGIYTTQQIFFNSNLIWIFNIPFIGGKITLILIFLILLFKLLNDQWIKKISTTIIHISILLLLFGSFITMKYNDEGLIIINENEKCNKMINKNKYTLGILDKNNKIGEFIDVNSKKINSNNEFNFKINQISQNSDIKNRTFFLNEKNASGIAKFYKLYSISNFVEEKNKFSITCYLFNNSEKKIFYLLEDIFNFKTINLNNKSYFYTLNKSIEILPFSLYLTNFKKEIYPGTIIPKSYTSNIIIKESNGLEWKFNIEMNKPFIYKNYTFYQTSYFENNLKNGTILTVVKNNGKIFPYLSCILILLGFFSYLLKIIPKLTMNNE